MTPRILIVYYSRTGHTKRVAEAIAAALGADLDEIRDRTRRTGILGYLRSGFQAAMKRHVPIGPAVRDPAKYDLVIVGTPIWNMTMSAPVRSYLHRHRDSLRTVAFFCTCGGRGGRRTFAQMAGVCYARPLATLSLREDEVDRSTSAIERFVGELRRAPAGAPPPTPTPPAIRPDATKS